MRTKIVLDLSIDCIKATMRCPRGLTPIQACVTNVFCNCVKEGLKNGMLENDATGEAHSRACSCMQAAFKKFALISHRRRSFAMAQGWPLGQAMKKGWWRLASTVRVACLSPYEMICPVLSFGGQATREAEANPLHHEARYFWIRVDVGKVLCLGMPVFLSARPYGFVLL